MASNYWLTVAKLLIVCSLARFSVHFELNSNATAAHWVAPAVQQISSQPMRNWQQNRAVRNVNSEGVEDPTAQQSNLFSSSSGSVTVRNVNATAAPPPPNNYANTYNTGQTAPNPNYGQTAPNPNYGQTASNPNYGQMASNPNYGQTAPNPNYNVNYGAPYPYYGNQYRDARNIGPNPMQPALNNLNPGQMVNNPGTYVRPNYATQFRGYYRTGANPNNTVSPYPPYYGSQYSSPNYTTTANYSAPAYNGTQYRGFFSDLYNSHDGFDRPSIFDQTLSYQERPGHEYDYDGLGRFFEHEPTGFSDPDRLIFNERERPGIFADQERPLIADAERLNIFAEHDRPSFSGQNIFNERPFQRPPQRYRRPVIRERELTIAALFRKDQCEGVKSANFTALLLLNHQVLCTTHSHFQTHCNNDISTITLTTLNPIVNQLQIVAVEANERGGLVSLEILALVVSGSNSLDGRFVYIRTVVSNREVLRYCSDWVTNFGNIRAENITLFILDHYTFDLHGCLESRSRCIEKARSAAITVCLGSASLF